MNEPRGRVNSPSSPGPGSEPSSSPPDTASFAVEAAALFAVSVSLLLVGIVSGTLIRHGVQAAPALAAGVLASRGIPWTRCAAIPVFAFWLFIMALIWLHVTGLAHLVKVRFTATEIGLTIVIGTSSAGGLVASLRARHRPIRWSGLVVIVLSGAIQIGVMWLSLRPILAHR